MNTFILACLCFGAAMAAPDGAGGAGRGRTISYQSPGSTVSFTQGAASVANSGGQNIGFAGALGGAGSDEGFGPLAIGPAARFGGDDGRDDDFSSGENQGFFAAGAAAAGQGAPAQAILINRPRPAVTRVYSAPSVAPAIRVPQIQQQISFNQQPVLRTSPPVVVPSRKAAKGQRVVIGGGSRRGGDSSEGYRGAIGGGKGPAQPARYQFTYGVNDAQTLNYQTRQEQRDGHRVQGVYTILDADGLLRTVHYGDDGKGFYATVSREPSKIFGGAAPGSLTVGAGGGGRQQGGYGGAGSDDQGRRFQGAGSGAGSSEEFNQRVGIQQGAGIGARKTIKHY